MYRPIVTDFYKTIIFFRYRLSSDGKGWSSYVGNVVGTLVAIPWTPIKLIFDSLSYLYQNIIVDSLVKFGLYLRVPADKDSTGSDDDNLVQNESNKKEREKKYSFFLQWFLSLESLSWCKILVGRVFTAGINIVPIVCLSVFVFPALLASTNLVGAISIIVFMVVGSLSITGGLTFMTFLFGYDTLGNCFTTALNCLLAGAITVFYPLHKILDTICTSWRRLTYAIDNNISADFSNSSSYHKKLLDTKFCNLISKKQNWMKRYDLNKSQKKSLEEVSAHDLNKSQISVLKILPRDSNNSQTPLTEALPLTLLKDKEYQDTLNYVIFFTHPNKYNCLNDDLEDLGGNVESIIITYLIHENHANNIGEMITKFNNPNFTTRAYKKNTSNFFALANLWGHLAKATGEIMYGKNTYAMLVLLELTEQYQTSFRERNKIKSGLLIDKINVFTKGLHKSEEIVFKKKKDNSVEKLGTFNKKSFNTSFFGELKSTHLFPEKKGLNIFWAHGQNCQGNVSEVNLYSRSKNYTIKSNEIQNSCNQQNEITVTFTPSLPSPPIQNSL